MVAAFLQAEIDSPRWGESIRQLLPKFQLTEAMVEHPDVGDPTQNSGRSALLGEWRGWRRNTLLFTGWPEGLEWSFVALGKADVANVRYANAPEWPALSRNTLRVTVFANRVKDGDRTIPEDAPVGAIRSIARAMRDGLTFPPLIAIGTPEASTIVMVEGHARMTAYALVGAKREIDALFGAGPRSRLRSWGWFPPEE